MAERIGGFTQVVTPDSQPNVDSAAYASGDLIGTKLTFSDVGRHGSQLYPGTGLIQSVVIMDAVKQNANLDLVMFDADPTATNFTDQDQFDIEYGDLAKVIGVASVETWKSQQDNSIGQVLNLGMPFDLGQATTMYGALVSRGTPTYTLVTGAIDALTIKVGILQD